MERNEFIKSLGFGLAMVCTGTCFEACGGKGSEIGGPETNPSPGGGGNGGGATASINLANQLKAVVTRRLQVGCCFLGLQMGTSVLHL